MPPSAQGNVLQLRTHPETGDVNRTKRPRRSCPTVTYRSSRGRGSSTVMAWRVFERADRMGKRDVVLDEVTARFSGVPREGVGPNCRRRKVWDQASKVVT